MIQQQEQNKRTKQQEQYEQEQHIEWLQNIHDLYKQHEGKLPGELKRQIFWTENAQRKNDARGA